MIIAPGYIGIDISKDHLDIFDGQARRIANTTAAIGEWMAELTAPRLVLFEATGRYDRHLQQALTRAGIGFARVNPLHARAFARATGQLAKTDRIDAACWPPWPRPSPPTHNRPPTPNGVNSPTCTAAATSWSASVRWNGPACTPPAPPSPPATPAI